MYGVLEKQFRKYFAEAERRRGNTGETLIQLLESRLDNVVYRMGFGSTRAEARQLVSHRAVELNGHTADIASMLVKAGDVITIRERPEARPYQGIARPGLQHRHPQWVEVDAAKMTGTFKSAPIALTSLATSTNRWSWNCTRVNRRPGAATRHLRRRIGGSLRHVCKSAAARYAVFGAAALRVKPHSSRPVFTFHPVHQPYRCNEPRVLKRNKIDVHSRFPEAALH